MKPDWDKLMDAYAGSEVALVADVDCTAAGEPLCETHGIEGFPTIKYGDPNALEDYQGERDFDSLKAFADENLKPTCSPINLDLCDDEKKAEIKKYQDMAEADLQKMIDEKEAELKAADQALEDGIKELQAKYEQMMVERSAKHDEIKKSGLSLMKVVMATSKMPDKKDEL